MTADRHSTALEFATRHSSAWHALWRALGVAQAESGLLQTIAQRYAEPQRHYHTLQHLEACLRQFDAVRQQAAQPGEVELALWFHDAIYEIRATDNEQLSADWARRVLLDAGAAAQVAQRVHALVLATRHSVEPCTNDESLLLDIDLSILGAPAAQFDQYEHQIRMEYAAVPAAEFRLRRKGILQGFLARAQIYRSADFHSRLEAQARANLRRSIERLGEAATIDPSVSTGDPDLR